MRSIKLLATLTKSEFLRFQDFVNSPFFNKRKDVCILVNKLRTKHPAIDISEEEVYHLVYGVQKFNRQVVRNLTSRLGELLEKFLSQLGVESEKTYGNISLVNELVKKGSTARADKIISKGISELRNETYSVEYLKKYYEYLETKEALVDGTESYKVKLENSIARGECAVNYYVLSLLRIANDYAAFKHVHRLEDRKEILNGFLNYFDLEKYLENMERTGSEYFAITAIFYYGLLSKLDDPGNLYREKLKKLVFENLDSLKLKDQYTCWTMLFAAYIFTSSVQKKPVNKEMHEINKLFVTRDLIPKDDMGFIAGSSYHNIAMQAIISKDFSWAESFLNSNKELVEPAKRENMYYVLMSSCLLGKGDYENCINFLSRAQVDNVMTKLIIRSTYIKCYYELGYFDEADSAIDALRMFMYQNKELTPQVKRSIPDFIKYSRLLLKAKSAGVKFPEKHYLKARNSHGFNSRTWVLEKMNELL